MPRHLLSLSLIALSVSPHANAMQCDTLEEKVCKAWMADYPLEVQERIATSDKRFEVKAWYVQQVVGEPEELKPHHELLHTELAKHLATHPRSERAKYTVQLTENTTCSVTPYAHGKDWIVFASQCDKSSVEQLTH